MTIKNIFSLILIASLFSNSVWANNISVSNISITGQNTASDFTLIEFDISWDNSWRIGTGATNWDAAWVFIKYQVGSGDWQHAWLNNTGHTAPSGSTIDAGFQDPGSAFNASTNPAMGVFIYRDVNGVGTLSLTDVQVRWNYGENGLSDGAIVNVQVFAIEMVHIPQGSFELGSGGTESGHFYEYPTTTSTFTVSSESAITIGTTSGNLYYDFASSGNGDQGGPLPAAYPKGFAATYCMKYEISQQGYVDFLNSLNTTQASNRFPNQNGNFRHNISESGGIYSTSTPYVACNYIRWNDLAAYLDWASLRPMSETEYEKICRGDQTPVANEYPWGTSTIHSSAYTINNQGNADEGVSVGYSTTIGNANHSATLGGLLGPYRVGIFAANGSNTGRITSGSTYYGVMEMMGNLTERVVSTGSSTGRNYTGIHGDGSLIASGAADVTNWPSFSTGVALKGGAWTDNSPTDLSVSSRRFSTSENGTQQPARGGRGVRNAQ